MTTDRSQSVSAEKAPSNTSSSSGTEESNAPRNAPSEDDNSPEEGGIAGIFNKVLLSLFGYFGEVVMLLGQTIRAMRHGVNLGDLFRQINVIGVETVPIALLTIGFTGAVLALYTVTTLVDYGAGDLVGGIVALSIVKEIGPILSGVVVAARAGSSMTAEIGSMKVTEQIDALRAMGISPIEYLIVPRVIAGIIIMPMLSLLANIGGIIGGAFVASSLGLSWATYFNSVRQLLDPDGSDIIKGLGKTVVFGILIVLIGCREGLNTEGGAIGVGSATTRSVVVAIILVFIANFFLSYIVFYPGSE
ncbi:MAG: MlaE family lipid ABC transporter permease subunit [Armatimonadaceae bacterium]